MNKTNKKSLEERINENDINAKKYSKLFDAHIKEIIFIYGIEDNNQEVIFDKLIIDDESIEDIYKYMLSRLSEYFVEQRMKYEDELSQIKKI
jgi:hypothetical protein